MKRVRRWTRVAALAGAFACWLILGAAPLHAQCFSDLQGADDEPGQKDLSEFCLNGACAGGFSDSWSFDDTNWNGNNTGDACALFDTDGDGLVNRAVCVTIVSPAAMQAGNPKCFTCGDSRPDRCTSSAPVACTSTCSVSSASDPFQLVPSHLANKCSGTNCRTLDTQTTCCLTTNDAGAGGVLIDVCSYPSQQPNADPSDCIENPGGCSSDTDCDDQNACTVDTCQNLGGQKTCVHVAGNAGTQCRGPAGICDAAEFCNGTSINCPPDGFTTGGICRNASDVCDVAESCDGTSIDCPADAVKAQGTLCRASTGQCDAAEVCDGSSTACPADGFQPNNTPCSDGDACTTGDVCTNGNCVGGPPPNCNDNNGCTDDGCNPASGCTHVNNNDSCNDGNACTTADACAGGGCVGGPPPDCNDNDVCTTDGCNQTTGCTHTNNTASCDDGNACTGPDSCLNDSCTGALVTCNDGNACTIDFCVPPTGCDTTPVAGCCNVDSDCADTDQCTTNEHCVDHACVSDPVGCNDNNACTDDGCNPATGCTHVNNNDSCDDGNACTTADACAGGGCVGGPPPDCNDNDVCTTDGCNQTTGCTHTNNTASCDDGDACTAGDTCSNDSCHGAFIDCDDSDGCTDDGCNPASGCTHTDNTDPCSDGNPCTLNDACAGGTCVSGPPKVCNDFNLCTNDTCNLSTGFCDFLNNSDPCDDANPCTEGDLCVMGDCVGASPTDCNDGNACTNDDCDISQGCTTDPVPGCCNFDNECADNDGCTENERCVDHECVSDPHDCSDNDQCTIDRCDSIMGGDFLCTSTPCFMVDPGLCPDPACIPPLCGNGVLDPGETCDPPDPTPIPNTTPAQPTCRNDCTFCGDSVLQPENGEICDDGTTAVGCTRKGFPVDPGRCQNNCTPPICKDPTKVQLAEKIDKYTFHGRLAVGSPINLLTKSLVLEVIEPRRQRAIYRASLPAGSLVSTSGLPTGPFAYVDLSGQTKISGGIYKIKIKDQSGEGFYRATVTAYGNLLGSRADMVPRIYVGASRWSVIGSWLRKSPTTWKFIPPESVRK